MGTESLERRLADLLGISVEDDRDYVADVLGSLVEIGDNPDDVVEYLTSFGASGDDLEQFAHDVKKFNTGEEMSSADAAADAEGVKPAAAAEMETKPKAKVLDEAAAQREEIRRRELEARERQREEQDRKRRQKEEEEERRRRDAAAAKKKQPGSKWNGKSSASAAIKYGQKTGLHPSLSVGKPQAKAAKQTAPKGVKKQPPREAAAPKEKETIGNKAKKRQSVPEKGTPKNKCCGCYGNKHKPLTNCLRCGRISCELEGVDDYCHFCGHYISGVPEIVAGDVDEKTRSALAHKERLLEFDRTSAARTHIHDDQEDYFVAGNSMWASEEEQREARDMEEERRKKLHERQRQTLKINF